MAAAQAACVGWGEAPATSPQAAGDNEGERAYLGPVGTPKPSPRDEPARDESAEINDLIADLRTDLEPRIERIAPAVVEDESFRGTYDAFVEMEALLDEWERTMNNPPEFERVKGEVLAGVRAIESECRLTLAREP